ncbi:hypothetical protein BH11MYX1_BH11MYX1_32360 [soil metagenome]
MIDFVPLATAKDSKGLRVVLNGVVPSPWSEAVKGVFRLAELPVIAVRAMPGDKELTAWTGTDNQPAVFHEREPVRTTAQAIVGLVARLAPGKVLPEEPAARVDAMGLIDLIAGEDGLGWNGRLAMIHAGLADNIGFPPPVAGYLGKRYGYKPGAMPALRSRVAAQFAVLLARFEAQRDRGFEYFGGAKPSAVDVYMATFLTPMVELAQEDCPRMMPAMLPAFGTAQTMFGGLVPPALNELRTKMFAEHLEFPISI